MKSIRCCLSFAALCLVAPFARAAESAPADASVPIVSSDEAVRRQLEGLNQLLNENPKLEETLRANPEALEAPAAAQAQSPDWAAYVKAHPEVVRALRTEKHFLLHRALARLTRRPLFRNDIADLDKFLDANADIGKAIDRRPRLLLDQEFQVAHPTLARFFEQHPGLATALYENAEKRQANPKGGKEKK